MVVKTQPVGIIFKMISCDGMETLLNFLFRVFSIPLTCVQIFGSILLIFFLLIQVFVNFTRRAIFQGKTVAVVKQICRSGKHLT